MKAPGTYSEWLDCFDAVREGTKDAEALGAVQKGTLVLSAGVAGRFAAQLSEVIQFRIKKASDKFSRAVQTSGGDLNALTNTLLLLRKEFKFLISLAKVPVLPSEDVQMLVKAIKDQANAMQKSLEATSLKNDRTGALSSIIKRNKVDNLED